MLKNGVGGKQGQAFCTKNIINTIFLKFLKAQMASSPQQFLMGRGCEEFPGLG